MLGTAQTDDANVGASRTDYLCDATNGCLGIIAEGEKVGAVGKRTIVTGKLPAFFQTVRFFALSAIMELGRTV